MGTFSMTVSINEGGSRRKNDDRPAYIRPQKHRIKGVELDAQQSCSHNTWLLTPKYIYIRLYFYIANPRNTTDKYVVLAESTNESQ